jgi:hypothetical protein
MNLLYVTVTVTTHCQIHISCRLIKNSKKLADKSEKAEGREKETTDKQERVIQRLRIHYFKAYQQMHNFFKKQRR